MGEKGRVFISSSVTMYRSLMLVIFISRSKRHRVAYPTACALLMLGWFFFQCVCEVLSAPLERQVKFGKTSSQKSLSRVVTSDN